MDLIDEQVLLSFFASCSAYYVRSGIESLASDVFRSDSILEKTRQTQRNTRRSGFQPSWQRSVNSSVVSRRTYSQVEARLAEKEGVWLVGDSLTWADLYLFHYLTSWAVAIPDLLKPLPKCQELVGAVQEIPLLKEWIAVRPKTPM